MELNSNLNSHAGLSSSNLTNTSSHLQASFEIELEDTNWILTSSFIIFTMQTGFGMLESGCVSIKNEANIMMKNLADISLGGLTYWIFGYGMSFGQGPYTNPFVGLGDFFVDPPVGDRLMGPVLASFLFQLSFATTATTIVSGAMAERCNFKAYCLFSSLNTVVYCVPAGWVWGDHGFLGKLGAVDIAGSGPVHLIGGASALASALMLGPRLGRYARGPKPLPLGSPVNAVMGTFVLWWGWLAFNSGSTYGVSGAKWQYAARAAVMTMMGSFGGGCFGFYTLIKNEGRADVMDLINSILGSLVSITAGCFLYRAWEALLIGAVGAMLVSLVGPLLDRCGVDDPVSASAVHGVGGIWGVIAVGIFADNPIPMDTTNGRSGLFKSGEWYLLGVQCLTVLCLMTWSILSTIALLWFINLILPIRMDPYEELLGADLTEHRIRHGQVGVSRAVSALRPHHRSASIEQVGGIGVNTGHSILVDRIMEARINRNKSQNRPPNAFETFTNHVRDSKDDGERKNKYSFGQRSRGFLNRSNPGNSTNELDRTINTITRQLERERRFENGRRIRTAFENGRPDGEREFKFRTSIDNSPRTKFENRTFLTSSSTLRNGSDGENENLPEYLTKTKKYKDLTVSDMENLNEIISNEDRFRHKLSETDYEDDIKRAHLTWVD